MHEVAEFERDLRSRTRQSSDEVPTDRDLISVFASLRDSADTAYVVSRDGRLLWHNAAWERFAQDNNGDSVLTDWRVGCSILDAMSPPLRAFYAEGFARACDEQTRWDHEYDCNSDNVIRKFRMSAYPLGHFVVVTHARIDHAHLADHPNALPALITMCSHCQRVQPLVDVKEWTWIPSIVAAPPEYVSHGLCPPCAQYYYPE